MNLKTLLPILKKSYLIKNNLTSHQNKNHILSISNIKIIKKPSSIIEEGFFCEEI